MLLPCCQAAVYSCLPQELRLPSSRPGPVMLLAHRQLSVRSSQQSLPGRRLAARLAQIAASSQHRAQAGIHMAHNNKQPGSRRGNTQMIQARNTRQQRDRISSFGIESAQMMRRGIRRASGASQRPSSLALVSGISCLHTLLLLNWHTPSQLPLACSPLCQLAFFQCLVKQSDMYCR